MAFANEAAVEKWSTWRAFRPVLANQICDVGRGQVLGCDFLQDRGECCLDRLDFRGTSKGLIVAREVDFRGGRRVKPDRRFSHLLPRRIARLDVQVSAGLPRPLELRRPVGNAKGALLICPCLPEQSVKPEVLIVRLHGHSGNGGSVGFAN